MYDAIAPGALQLGCRFAGFGTPETVHEVTGKPIMITEFAFSEGVSAGIQR